MPRRKRRKEHPPVSPEFLKEAVYRDYLITHNHTKGWKKYSVELDVEAINILEKEARKLKVSLEAYLLAVIKEGLDKELGIIPCGNK